MGIIGKTTSSGGGREGFPTTSNYHVNKVDSYTPSADEELDQAFIDNESKTVETTIDVGVVRVSDGVLMSTVSLVSPADAGGTRQVLSATYPAGVILSAGVEYAHVVGSSADSNGFFGFRSGGGATDNETVAESGYPMAGPLSLPGTADNLIRHSYSTTKAIASTPTITDINTNNEFTPGATNTLNGENLSETGGSIVIDGEAQTITSRTATAIEFTGVRGGNPYNQDLTLTYTDADSNEVTQTVQQVPATGFAVTAASPNTTDDASMWSGLVDTSTGDPVTVVDGDQALVTDPNSLGNLAVTPAGEISADEEGDFTVQFWRASEEVWGSDQTVAFEVPSEPEPTDLEAKKKQNNRRRYTANLYGAWRNRFR